MMATTVMTEMMMGMATMTKWTIPEHDQRLLKILKRLVRASEVTLQRVEAELGMAVRAESPDAERPWRATND